MSFYDPTAIRGLQVLFRLGFDRLWFAMAVIVSLAIAAQAAELLMYWLVPLPI